MGQSCELMARRWGIRREAQDELALASHQRAAAAYDAGFFDDLVVEFSGVQRDNNLRRDTSLARLATLKPAFPVDGSATLTAGNSTPMTDGAAAVLLASEDWARARGLPVQAYLTFGKVAAVDFLHDEGLLMAPAYAVPRMLDDAGITLQDFDFYEIHEAFAAQVLCTLAAWESRGVLPGPAGSRAAARLHRSCEAQREWQQPRRGPSVCSDRGTHRRDARQTDRSARRRPWAHLDLHGRWHGRHRDRRTLKTL